MARRASTCAAAVPLNGGNTTANQTLVLVAHGSAEESGVGGFAAALARRLRNRGCFAAVEAAFLHSRPSLAEVLGRIDGRDIRIVPLLSGPGRHARQTIPAAIHAFRRARPKRRVRLTEPLGTHPACIESMAHRVRALAERARVETGHCTFLAIGHGRTGAGDMAARLAAALEPDFAASLALYLRGDPSARRWAAQARTKDVLVVRALFGAGNHMQCDVPRLFGLSRLPAPVSDRIDGPWRYAGRRFWWATVPPAGAAAADTVIDLARDGRWRASAPPGLRVR